MLVGFESVIVAVLVPPALMEVGEKALETETVLVTVSVACDNEALVTPCLVVIAPALIVFCRGPLLVPTTLTLMEQTPFAAMVVVLNFKLVLPAAIAAPLESVRV